MPTEKLKTEIRKEQIAQAGLDVIASQGVKGLSIARVATRIGLVPSAIYRHFTNKEELLDCILGVIEERLLGNVAVAKNLRVSPMERLKMLLDLHVRFIRENKGVLRIIFSDDLYGNRLIRKARVYSLIRRYLREVEDLAREGQAQGQLHPGADPQTVSIMFLGLIQPAAILWNLSDGDFDVTRHTEKAWLIFREMIQQTSVERVSGMASEKEEEEK